MNEVKITQIGNSLGITLPKEVLTKLGAGKGETLYLVPEPGGYSLTALSPEVAAQIDKATEIANRYRNTLKKLAE